MKNLKKGCLRGILVLFAIFFMNGRMYANHINGIDLGYTWVSGNTYKVELTVYGNCGSSTFGSLATAVPVICIFDSSHYDTSINLALSGPGVNVSNVCPRDTDSTTCTNTAYAIPGTKKYVYTGTITLSSAQKCWRFVFTGQMGATSAGRVATTNLTGITIIYLQDTLDNLIGSNNSPDLTVIPTPYYCQNNQDNYNPGGVDPDGDSLYFSLVSALTNGGGGCTTASSAVGYTAGYSGSNPLHYTAGTYSFGTATGQISFTPDITGTFAAVYNIREYRGGQVVGTSQREMYFLVQTCTVSPPTGAITGASIGTIVDSVEYSVCAGSGAFSFVITPTEPDTTNTITVTSIGVPAWATMTIINNGTNHPTCTFAGNATTAAPGTYTFTLNYVDNNCPISGSNTITYTVIIATRPLAITFPKDSVCVGSTVTYSDATAGGTWSSAAIGTATVVAGTGVVTGVAAGSTTITYSTASDGCYRDTVINVEPLPNAITGTLTVCIGTTSTLGETTAGGTWTSGTPGVATVSGTGVVHGVAVGTANISYTMPTGCYIIAVVTVNSTPSVITGSPTAVCVGSVITYTDSISGGTWSSSNAGLATVGGSGNITGVASGVPTITYSIGSCFKTKAVTVNPDTPIVGPTSVCIGNTITLTNAIAGGTWTSGTPTVATISATGVVTGVAAGTTTIVYTLPTGCTSSLLITVVALPSPITGTLTVCTGLTTSLNDATPGGTWASGTPADATISGTGVVTGVLAGTSVITYTVGTGCYVTAIVTVNTSPAAITGGLALCVGANSTLADVTPGGTWSSITPAVATITAGGVATGVTVGTSLISYTIATCASTVTVTVSALPNAGSIVAGTGVICVGSTLLLTDAAGGGTWSSVTPAIATVSATGLVTGVANGTDSIKYTVNNSCGTAVAATIVTVNPLPNAGSISGPTAVCAGSAITLTDATPGGTWSSTMPTVATVSATGVVNGIASGTTTISYTVTNSCGTAAATSIVSVNTAAIAGVISGANVICVGTFAIMTDPVGGGTWSSSSANATITGAGVATGVTAGLDTILYTVTDACGPVSATHPVTILPLPVVAPVTGPTSVCISSTITLSDATAGGTWHATNSNGTISATGVVTGVTAGMDTFFYSVTNVCGTTNDSAFVTINPLPSPGTLTGPSNVCVGTNITLTDPSAGGVFSASNGNATVGAASGVVTGVTAGVDTIVYTVTNVCGTATTVKDITVNPAPVSGSISGPGTVCVGASITLANSVGGGVWSASNGDATVTAGGVVTGVTGGTDVINYTMTTVCGTLVNTFDVVVNPLAVPGTISGPSTVCSGSMATMTATVAGGVWGMTNSNATISAGGIVTGATAGVDTVTYAVTNICGTQTATTTITVDAYPVAGVISGPSVVCVGGTATLTETVAGGAWSSSSALTTVSGTGVVTGVTAGTDTISYTVTNSCGTVGTSQVMTILGLPAPGAISSPASSICVGGMATMTDPTPGGIWSSTNGAIATVAGGVVTGVAAGSDTILYSMTNTCGTVSSSMPITVVNFPTAGVISGPSMVCDGSAITLLDSAPGGIWAASNGNATLLAPGIVSGVTVGTDTIFYSVTNVCGTASVNTIISIDPVPVVSPISGPSTLCVSSIASLLDATSGGTWTSSTPGLVTIDVASGLMTGLSVGTSTITYTVTNAEGCPTSVTQTETVNAAPVIPAITGTLSECVGGTSMLSDSLAGGTWSSSNTAVATIDATGNVTGVTAGSATITYTVSGTCGSSFVTATDVVNALPTVAAISGSTSGCVGMANTLADATSGGVWSSSDNTIATVSATGVVTGIAPGTATIFYTVTNTAGCTAQASVSYTVNGLPVVAAITGIMSECIGGSQLLSDGTSGGTWSSSNTAVATVDGSGNVTGISAGIASISYTVTNGAGCMASATASDTVLSTPVSSPITGTLSVCVGATTALGNGVPYGTWSSSNTAVATVDAVSGVVTGVSVGSATIMYNVTNMCGSITDNATVNVMATPTVAPVTATTATLCAGATTTVSDVTAGGTWSVSDSTIATINPTTGVVTGYGMGIVTVTYTVVNTAGCFGDATATLDFGSSIGSSYISPSSATICDGHTVYLQVLTSGTGLSYQWLYNGVAIPGATNNNYTADTAGNYSAIVSNGTCTETLAGAMVVNMSTPGIGMTPPNVLYTGSYASYQWYLNGSAIPGATNSIYVETAPGVYQVAVSDASGCTLTSATDTVASGSGSGVAIINYASQIRLYPNPATSVLSIVSPVTVNAKVMSPDGKMVIEQKNASKVDVSGLSDGLYIIMIYDENDLLLKTDKFMKLN